MAFALFYNTEDLAHVRDSFSRVAPGLVPKADRDLATKYARNAELVNPQQAAQAPVDKRCRDDDTKTIVFTEGTLTEFASLCYRLATISEDFAFLRIIADEFASSGAAEPWPPA